MTNQHELVRHQVRSQDRKNRVFVQATTACADKRQGHRTSPKIIGDALEVWVTEKTRELAALNTNRWNHYVRSGMAFRRV